MIIHTFCEAYPELKDKTIILFGTHGGSGIGSYTTKLKGHFPNAKYLEALGISGASIRDAESKTKVENWLNKIGFEKEITNDMTISITASGKSTGSPWGNNNQDSFLESMAAAAQAVHNYFKQDGKDIIYINVMNNMSVDCDCDGHPASPKLKDMGILASTDPVALDQACLDLVFNHEDTSGDDAQPLQKRINSLHGTHITEYAEQIGLGSMKYNIVNIDK